MSKPSRPDQFDAAAQVPRYALTAAEVCLAFGISQTTLNTLVSEGSIPKGFAIPGHPRLIRWDPDDLRATVKDWKERANLGEGDWGGVR